MFPGVFSATHAARRSLAPVPAVAAHAAVRSHNALTGTGVPSGLQSGAGRPAAVDSAAPPPMCRCSMALRLFSLKDNLVYKVVGLNRIPGTWEAAIGCHVLMKKEERGIIPAPSLAKSNRKWLGFLRGLHNYLKNHLSGECCDRNRQVNALTDRI